MKEDLDLLNMKNQRKQIQVSKLESNEELRTGEIDSHELSEHVLEESLEITQQKEPEKNKSMVSSDSANFEDDFDEMNNFVKEQILSDSNLQDSEADVNEFANESSTYNKAEIKSGEKTSEHYYVFSEEDKMSSNSKDDVPVQSLAIQPALPSYRSKHTTTLHTSNQEGVNSLFDHFKTFEQDRGYLKTRQYSIPNNENHFGSNTKSEIKKHLPQKSIQYSLPKTQRGQIENPLLAPYSNLRTLVGSHIEDGGFLT